MPSSRSLKVTTGKTGPNISLRIMLMYLNKQIQR